MVPQLTVVRRGGGGGCRATTHGSPERVLRAGQIFQEMTKAVNRLGESCPFLADPCLFSRNICAGAAQGDDQDGQQAG